MVVPTIWNLFISILLPHLEIVFVETSIRILEMCLRQYAPGYDWYRFSPCNQKFSGTIPSADTLNVLVRILL